MGPTVYSRAKKYVIGLQPETVQGHAAEQSGRINGQKSSRVPSAQRQDHPLPAHSGQPEAFNTANREQDDSRKTGPAS